MAGLGLQWELLWEESMISLDPEMMAVLPLFPPLPLLSPVTFSYTGDQRKPNHVEVTGPEE